MTKTYLLQIIQKATECLACDDLFEEKQENDLKKIVEQLDNFYLMNFELPF